MMGKTEKYYKQKDDYDFGRPYKLPEEDAWYFKEDTAFKVYFWIMAGIPVIGLLLCLTVWSVYTLFFNYSLGGLVAVVLAGATMTVPLWALVIREVSIHYKAYKADKEKKGLK